MQVLLTLQAPIPQNGQTYSNNSLAKVCLSVFYHSLGLVLKGLRRIILQIIPILKLPFVEFPMVRDVSDV